MKQGLEVARDRPLEEREDIERWRAMRELCERQPDLSVVKQRCQQKLEAILHGNEQRRRAPGR